VERYPPVAVLGAAVQALVGRAAAAERWADAADHPVAAAGAASAAQMPPDGSTMEGYLAMLRSLLCRDGAGRMRADVEAALAGLSPASPWRTATMVFKGVSELLEDRADHADAVLAHAVEVGRHAGALPAVSTALAERCLLAIERDDWTKAETLAEQALSTLQAGRLDDYIMSPLVHVVVARTALHGGDLPGPGSTLPGRLVCGRCSPTRFPGARCRRCWSWARPTSCWTTSPAPERSCARRGTSCNCEPTSASCPHRSRNCGPGWT
jgi:hypothetical protein